jgi:NAD+ kinase
MTALQCIGVLAHPKRPQTSPVAHQVIASLQERQITTWLHEQWDENSVLDDVQCADMVIAIGGDGAMLKAARVCAPYNVPVLGLNMGRLGFLTEIAGPPEWENSLSVILKGDYWIEKRMMVTASVVRGNALVYQGDALNDVVVSGGTIGRMVQVDLYIDQYWATTYNADALIIATPTGSTAYALASGGPILPPDLLNILIVPTAPHLSMDRSIVISEGSHIDVCPAIDNRHTVSLQVDGNDVVQLAEDDILRVNASKHVAKFVRMRNRNYFYRSLLDRLEPRVNRNEARRRSLRLDQLDDVINPGGAASH